MNGLRQLVEQDLEAAKALIEEVFGFVTQTARIGFGGLDDLARTLLGGANHLGALHHALGLHTRCFEHLVGFATGLRDELLTLLEHPARLAQFVGQSLERAFEHVDNFGAVDAGRR